MASTKTVSNGYEIEIEKLSGTKKSCLTQNEFQLCLSEVTFHKIILILPFFQYESPKF